MPTGYVHCMLEKNLDFKGFVWECARAFGALISMRDEPMGVTIPTELKQDTYYANRIEESIKEFNRLMNLTPAEQIAYGNAKKHQELANCKEQLEQRRETNIKINGMILKVQEWNPPTQDHVGLKAFMISQLTSSIDGEDYLLKELAQFETKSGLDFYSRDLQMYTDNIKSYTEYNDKEIESTKNRNKWLKDLQESLPL